MPYDIEMPFTDKRGSAITIPKATKLMHSIHVHCSRERVSFTVSLAQNVVWTGVCGAEAENLKKLSQPYNTC